MYTEATPLLKRRNVSPAAGPLLHLLTLSAVIVIYRAAVGDISLNSRYEDAVQLRSEKITGRLESMTIRATEHPLIYCANICLSKHHNDDNTKVVVAWKPLESSLGWIQSPAFKVNTMDIEGKKECAEVVMYRLRASSEYAVMVSLKTNTTEKKIHSDTFITGSTGFKFFDMKFAVQNGTNMPSWDLVTTSGSYRDRGMIEEGFQGIFTIDAEGWVVWFYDSKAYTYVFDFALDHTLVTLHAHNTNDIYPGALLQVSLDGKILQNHTRDGCETMDTFGLLDHETRFHINSEGDWLVFSTLKTVQDFNRTAGFDEHIYNSSFFSGGQIIKWNVQTAEMAHFYNLFDEITPFRDVYTERNGADYHTLDAQCRTTEWTHVLDYMHMNSVSVSRYDGSLIISLHSLSTVLSFDYNGSGVNWIISCSIAHLSDFTFESEDAMFSQQHDVQQIKNGNLLMMDNGHKVDGVLNSRALELQLDFNNSVVLVGWQHVIDRYSELGGSITQTADEDGPYVAAYCKLVGTEIASMDSLSQHPSRLYEIERNGTVKSLLEIPAPNDNWEAGNYRVIPQSTLGGELSVLDDEYYWGE